MIQRFDQVAVHLPEPDGPNPAAADAVQELMGEHSANVHADELHVPVVQFSGSGQISPMLRAQSGADFDRAYRKHSGVEGRQNLNATMEKVQSKAADATLKPIAATNAAAHQKPPASLAG
jgi:hypothetical protein